jgi:hypothetical protein
VTLRKVVTDAYFREGNRKNPNVKARATAWALTYYLAEKKLDALSNYFKELSNLPRDLQLDQDAMLDCFARAMGCVDAQGKRDDAGLSKLANDWFSSMEQDRDFKLEPEAAPIFEAIYKMQTKLAAEFKEASKPGIIPDGGFTPGGYGPGGYGPGPRPGGPGGYSPGPRPGGPGGYSPGPRPGGSGGYSPGPVPGVSGPRPGRRGR